ncbi:hypothetical protein [Muricoccus roseus]|uniref:hypothetical protein n=1 Tax=Muricoccus roseus TaxID=198092 RepID=UPI001C317079|nr:hypothetical protein [Roseomonas rosea]
MIDEGCREYAPEPSANRADIPQLPGTFERPKREVLQEFFGLVSAAQSVTQKSKEFLPRLDKRTSHSGVRWLRGPLSFRIIFRMLVIGPAPFRHCPAGSSKIETPSGNAANSKGL